MQWGLKPHNAFSNPPQGRAWPPRSRRARRSGMPLAGRFKAAFTQTLGDWKWLREVLKLDFHYGVGGTAASYKCSFAYQTHSASPRPHFRFPPPPTARHRPARPPVRQSAFPLNARLPVHPPTHRPTDRPTFPPVYPSTRVATFPPDCPRAALRPCARRHLPQVRGREDRGRVELRRLRHGRAVDASPSASRRPGALRARPADDHPRIRPALRISPHSF